MKIGIVGGTGNISLSVVQLLLTQDHEVHCFNRGKTQAVPLGVTHIQGDRYARADFEERMQAENFDVAIDMMCFDAEDAASSIRAFRGVQQFIQCSSCATYGTAFDWMPVTEDHPLRPTSGYGQGKAAADNVFMEAYYREHFPVTILKPSTTYGPKQGLIRQLSRGKKQGRYIPWDYSWLDRIRKHKPVLICGDGLVVHQFLHVDDAALAFAGAIGKSRCIGQVYNLVGRSFITWRDYHSLAAQVLGVEAELVGVPLADLQTLDIPILVVENAHNKYFSCQKLMRDVPEFEPRVSLENGMRQMIQIMHADGRIPNSDAITWEDDVIAAQRRVAH